MASYLIENTASEEIFGIYDGETASLALDALARDAGFQNQADLESIIYESADYAAACRAELRITRISG